MSPECRTQAAAGLRAILTTLPAWQDARSVLLFMPLPDEPALGELLEQALAVGKLVALPAFDRVSGTYLTRRTSCREQDLAPAQFGVLEPRSHCPIVPAGELDFAVVPGLAFSPGGKRLGRGRGFYDRLLASFRAVSCGVAFDEQVVPDLPAEPHDITMTYLATPTRLWDCRALTS